MFVSRLIGIARPDIVATISDLNQSQYKSFCDALKRSRFKSEFYILPRVLLIVAVSPQPGLILLDVLPPGQEEAGHQPMRGRYWNPLTNQRPVWGLSAGLGYQWPHLVTREVTGPGCRDRDSDHNSDKIPRNGSISNSTWVVQLNSEATSLTTKLILKLPPSSDDNFKINNHFNYCQLLLIDKDPRYYFDHVYKVRLSDFKNLVD